MVEPGFAFLSQRSSDIPFLQRKAIADELAVFRKSKEAGANGFVRTLKRRSTLPNLPEIATARHNMTDLVLSPMAATIIFLIVCLAGHRYRHVWKSEGPRYQYWMFGLVAATGLLVLGFVPIDIAGSDAVSQ